MMIVRQYQTKAEVPWKDVLNILYWGLELRVRHIQHQQKRGDSRAAALSMPQLRTNHRAVQSLRRFLCCRGETKWEREARFLLESEAREP